MLISHMTTHLSDDLELCYHTSKTAISEEFLEKSVGDLWKFSTAQNHVGQLVAPGSAAQRHLDLIANITINQQVTLYPHVCCSFHLFDLCQANIQPHATSFGPIAKRARSVSSGSSHRAVRYKGKLLNCVPVAPHF